MAALPDPILAETLRKVPLLEDLPHESDACFAALRRGEMQDFASGETLLARGPSDHALFLVEGAVRRANDDRVCSVPGSYFGVLELATGRECHDALSAVTPVRAFVLDEPAVREMLGACPRLVMRLLSDCARKLLEDHEHE